MPNHSGRSASTIFEIARFFFFVFNSSDDAHHLCRCSMAAPTMPASFRSSRRDDLRMVRKNAYFSA